MHAHLGASLVEAIPRATQILLDGDLEGADYLHPRRRRASTQRCTRARGALLPGARPAGADGQRPAQAIIAVVKMIGEVERSADLCVNICKAARRLYGHDLDPRLRGFITQMSDQAQQLMRVRHRRLRRARRRRSAAALDDIDDLLDRLQVVVHRSRSSSATPGTAPTCRSPCSWPSSPASTSASATTPSTSASGSATGHRPDARTRNGPRGRAREEPAAVLGRRRRGREPSDGVRRHRRGRRRCAGRRAS